MSRISEHRFFLNIATWFRNSLPHAPLFPLKTHAKSATQTSRKTRDLDAQDPRPTSSSYIRCLATLHHAPACGQGSLLNQNPAQEFEVVEGLRCAEHHAGERVVFALAKGSHQEA